MCHELEVSNDFSVIDYNGFPKCDITLQNESCEVYTKQCEGAPIKYNFKLYSCIKYNSNKIK